MCRAALQNVGSRKGRSDQIAAVAEGYVGLIVELRGAEPLAAAILTQVQGLYRANETHFTIWNVREATALQAAMQFCRRLINGTAGTAFSLRLEPLHPYHHADLVLPERFAAEVKRAIASEWRATISRSWQELPDLRESINELQVRLDQEELAAHQQFVRTPNGPAPLAPSEPRGEAAESNAVVKLLDPTSGILAGLNDTSEAGASPAIRAIDSNNHTIVVLGETVPLMPDQYLLVVEIMKGRGQWVGLTKTQGTKRPDKIIKRVPTALRRFIESREGAGGGYRIDPKHIAAGVIGA
jgi:hypothetical protein